MSVRIVKNSRLLFSALVLVDGVEFWDLNTLPIIPVRNDEIQYTVTFTDRIDLLAYRFYGDPVLWWVIAAANSFELLPNDLKPGETIRIPSSAFISESLFRQKRAVY
jgi:hypothetical protein